MVPLVLGFITGSSTIFLPFHFLVTSGSPDIPNCAIKFLITLKKGIGASVGFISASAALHVPSATVDKQSETKRQSALCTFAPTQEKHSVRRRPRCSAKRRKQTFRSGRGKVVVVERRFYPDQQCGSAKQIRHLLDPFETRTNTLAFGTGRLS